MANRSHYQTSSSSSSVSLTKAAKIDTLVEYSFERNEKSNLLAIHPGRPLIAYLINIQRNTKISKGWTSNIDPTHSPSSSINGQSSYNHADKNKTVSIRIMDYVTRQRCLAKGIYHARPADCVFTINSYTCSQSDNVKLAVVDRLANVYLYDVSYFINELTATRILVIRSPSHDISPYDSINLVWCPFVPCEDFENGDGGLRLALSTDTRIEVFAIDRLQGKTGEFQRNELRGAYKCINGAHKAEIATLSISPDCSTISAAALDNQVTFFSIDLDNDGHKCLHSWDAPTSDKTSISRLFFLDDFPKLLEDSSMKFWGAAFIGTRGGQMLLVDLRTWTVYQTLDLASDTSGPKNFDYRISITSRNVVAMNNGQCFVVQIEHQTEEKHQNTCLNNSISSDYTGLPTIVRTTKLCSPSRQDPQSSQIYSFVIKHRPDNELEMFTISAGSLDMWVIDLNALKVEEKPPAAPTNAITNILQQLTGNKAVPGAGMSQELLTPSSNSNQKSNHETTIAAPTKHDMNVMVETLFSKLNSAFSQGLDEFLADVRHEVNDLKTKLDGLSRDVRKLNQQLQEIRQK